MFVMTPAWHRHRGAVFLSLAPHCWILLSAASASVALTAGPCHDGDMPRRTVSRRATVSRAQLTEAIGRAVTRFQDGSNAFDEVAAEILALERGDLAVMTQLLYRGSASADELAAALHVKRGPVLVTLERLQLAGYARAQAGSRTRIELSDHARAWIERIWTPLWRKGAQVLDTYPVAELEPVARFILQACAIQDARTRQLRTWLGVVANHGPAIASARRPVTRRLAPRPAVRRGQPRRPDSSRRHGRSGGAQRLSLRARVPHVRWDDAARLCRTPPDRAREDAADRKRRSRSPTLRSKRDSARKAGSRRLSSGGPASPRASFAAADSNAAAISRSR